MPYRIIERTNTRTNEKDYVVQSKFLFWWETAQYYGDAISPNLEAALAIKNILEEKENIKYTKKVIDAY